MAALQREKLSNLELGKERTFNAVTMIQNNKLQKQLNSHETKRKRKEAGDSLIVDGNAVCLTSAEMLAVAKETRMRKIAEEAAKKKRKEDRMALDDVRKAWAAEDKARKERNKLARARYKEQQTVFDEERKRVKNTPGAKNQLQKPKLVLEKEAPKPWLDGRAAPGTVEGPEDDEMADGSDGEEDALSD